jgi:hypothetical protein
MVSETEMKIARFRLEEMPSHVKIAVGNHGSFGKKELKKRMDEGDEVGKAFADMQMNMIRSFKEY